MPGDNDAIIDPYLPLSARFEGRTVGMRVNRRGQAAS
jgi:hypothetical protein